MAERVKRGRRWLRALAAAVPVALLVWAVFVEPRWVEVTHHGIGNPRVAPSDARPLRLVQLSDLHLHGVGARERRVAALARAERPDLVLLTGDLVESADALPTLEAFLALLGDEAPILAIPGNWEHWGEVPFGSLSEVLERHHGRLLVDESALGEHAGLRWAVVGLDWPAGRLRRGDRALEPGVNRLVLLHAPEGRAAWSGPPVAAMLSGHTHGGQVAVAGHAPMLPPGSGVYVSGWYRGPPVDLYVSRGIGTSVLPVRFGARPEVAVFEWWLE